MFDERSPIYRQIADRVRADVLSGALERDEQVMSTNQYAAFYRINPATVAKAYQRLVDDEVLYKRRGVAWSSRRVRGSGSRRRTASASSAMWWSRWSRGAGYRRAAAGWR